MRTFHPHRPPRIRSNARHAAGDPSDTEFDATESRRKRANGSALAGRRMVTAALLVAMMVTAMEQLVVSPAMPTIIAQLKGFEIYPWVISAYLLAATVSTPIYGKLADLYRPQARPALRPGALQPGLDPLGHVASRWGS